MESALQIGRPLPRSRVRRWTRLLAVLALTGVSIVIPVKVASSGAATPVVNLCSVSSQVTAIRISRGIPLNPEVFSFPRLVFTKRAASTRAVAAALCALPGMPSGPIACPADFGFDYSLLFSVPGDYVTDVRYDPTGCEQVTGLGTVRWTVQTPIFIRVLGSAMNLKHVSDSIFAGKIS